MWGGSTLGAGWGLGLSWAWLYPKLPICCPPRRGAGVARGHAVCRGLGKGLSTPWGSAQLCAWK